MVICSSDGEKDEYMIIQPVYSQRVGHGVCVWCAGAAIYFLDRNARDEGAVA